MLSSLVAQPEDKIIRLIKEFKDDPRQDKIDLGVGVYRDRTGLTPIMKSVKKAEKQLWQTEQTKAYTGIAGDPEFRNSMVTLILGDQNPTGKVSTIHTPGGTGAVRQALELVKVAVPNSCIWISDPSWPNHLSITRHLGLKIATYRYFDHETRRVNFSGMMEDLSQVSSGDILILHGCCHNPTGADLNQHQWREIANFSLKKNLIPLIDIAYQGFGDGIIEDTKGVQTMVQNLPEILIAASCSKNFGIYRERTGVLIAIADTSLASNLAQANMTHLNRQNYSFPPDHGARLVSMILNDGDLRQNWEQELKTIREGMIGLRQSLVAELRRLTGSDRFGFIGEHRGMFSLLGATEDQVMKMRKYAGIYMVSDGRINVAGLNEDTVPILAKAMLDVGL